MREFVIWSKFGLWRSIDEAELTAGNVVEHDQPIADVDRLGYCLTYIDCEPVAILPEYPEDDAPEAVNEWLAQSPDFEPEA